MGYYIDQQGNYYEGDKADYRDTSVPQRPSPFYDWVGNQWVTNVARQTQAVCADNYKGLIRRRANYLTRTSKEYDALILLKTIGE